MQRVVPLRSVLYVPGSNARALEKCCTLDADAVILDLEDAVAPSAKIEARSLVAAALASGGFGRRTTVARVNGADTPWGGDDLTAMAQAGADAVLLPKVASAQTVREAEAALVAAGAPETLALWAMIETPRGVLALDAIGGSSRRLSCLVAGTSDLTKDLGARASRERFEVLASLSLIVLAARAHGLVALDGVHLALDDAEGLELACRQGRDLGFDGKTLVHPLQIASANRAFAPTAEELSHARRIAAAHADAEAQGRGVVVVDGRVV